MNLKINIGDKNRSMNHLHRIKNNRYVPFDIKIINCHITSLNKKIGYDIFRNDTLFVNSQTLWEIMQPVGGKGTHNFHGLTEEDVYMALKAIQNPKVVFTTKNSRYSIITVELSHFNEPLMIVVETNSKLIGNIKAKVNKIVTIHPKDKIENLIKCIDQDLILYIKN